MSILRRKYFRLGEKIADFIFGMAWATCRVAWTLIPLVACGTWRAVVIASGHLRAWRRPVRRYVPAPATAHRVPTWENKSQTLAVRALQKLGFSEKSARNQVDVAAGALGENAELESLIREALRKR